MNDKIFCGSGRILSNQYGEMPKISMNKDDINTIVQWMKDNGKEWVNINMKAKKNVSGKNTHYLEVDTWQPTENKQTHQEDNSEPPAFIEDIKPEFEDDGKSMKERLMSMNPPPPKDDDLPF